MEASTITTLISSVGFPIVCCFFCGYFINTTLKEFQKSITENTNAVNKLILILEKKEGD